MVSDLTCYSLGVAKYVHVYWHDARGFVEACHYNSELSISHYVAFCLDHRRGSQLRAP